MRGAVASDGSVSGSPTWHQATWCEYNNPADDSTGWFFRNSASSQALVARISTSSAYFSGELRASADVVAYYSDERLKNIHGNIPEPINKVMQLNGYYWTENDDAYDLGYRNPQMQIGVSAQEISKVLPELIKTAPISENSDTDYMTVDYGKITPLLIEAIKEQQAQINELQTKLGIA